MHIRSFHFIVASLFFLCSKASQLIQTRNSYDGVGNNLQNILWGSAGRSMGYFPQVAQLKGSPVPLQPLTDISQPLIEAAIGLPNARLISNTIAKVPGDPEPVAGPASPLSISELVTYWGEFIAQDLSHVVPKSQSPLSDISIPSTDVFSGNHSIPFIRAEFLSRTNVSVSSFQFDTRTPISAATSFMDASMIYGVDKQALALRIDGFKIKMES
ncbi:hypothetical protein HK096_007891, partial [Nowakowskiella sp. JEL0078]